MEIGRNCGPGRHQRTANRREQVLDPIKELREGSLDYYAAVRAAWFQKREEELRKGARSKTEDVDKLFSAVK